jgi:hypothetical protein
MRLSNMHVDQWKLEYMYFDMLHFRMEIFLELGPSVIHGTEIGNRNRVLVSTSMYDMLMQPEMTG